MTAETEGPEASYANDRAELDAALAQFPGWDCHDLYEIGSVSAQRYTVWDAFGGSQLKPWASVYSTGESGWQWFASVNIRDRMGDGAASSASEALAAADTALNGYLAGGDTTP